MGLVPEAYTCPMSRFYILYIRQNVVVVIYTEVDGILFFVSSVINVRRNSKNSNNDNSKINNINMGSCSKGCPSDTRAPPFILDVFLPTQN